MPKSPPITVADLLHRARQISQEQLKRALETAQRTNEPPGSILVHEGTISSESLRTAILAHSLLVEKLVPEDITIEAIAKAAEQNINLEESLESLGWRLDYRLVTGRLCQILIESGSVGEADLKTAVDASNASGLPLGRVLVIRKFMPEALAYAALTAQILIKEGRVNSHQAIEGLKLCYAKHIPIEEALIQIGAVPQGKKDPLRLGQLLVLAGMLKEVDLLSAVEKGMAEETPLGQVLVNQGLIPPEVLDRALAIQALINDRSLSKLRGVAQLQGKEIDESPGAETTHLSRLYEEMPESVKAFGVYTKDDWFKTIQELTLEKQNLAFKVVNQEEQMKHSLARDLHDTIIADLMMLKRYLDGDRDMSKADIKAIVDDVVRQLRDICSDFAPRNFKEWGMEMTLKDMLDRMSERTGINVDFLCEVELPSLPEAVGLHIFRIIQEGVNNIEKYSNASQVTLRLEKPSSKKLLLLLSDNGKGFDTGEQRGVREDGGGMGMHSMRERADLIRCFFPTKLTLDSSPGKGATIKMEIDLH
jgi:signal transduction histidine kinase